MKYSINSNAIQMQFKWNMKYQRHLAVMIKSIQIQFKWTIKEVIASNLNPLKLNSNDFQSKLATKLRRQALSEDLSDDDRMASLLPWRHNRNSWN